MPLSSNGEKSQNNITLFSNSLLTSLVQNINDIGAVEFVSFNDKHP